MDLSIELLKTISLALFILSAVMFLVAVSLFFLLNVPKLVGDITGSTARKAIESIRKQNEESGDKAYKPSPVNLARGKTTEKISSSGQLVKNSPNLGVSVGTEQLSKTPDPPPAPPRKKEKGNAAAPAVSTPVSNETMILSDVLPPQTAGETVLLSEIAATFSVDFQLGYMASSEVIE